MKKVDIYSSEGTKNDSSTNAQDQNVSQHSSNEMLSAAISKKRVVAVFMGAEITDGTIGWTERDVLFPKKIDGLYLHSSKNLKYDSSWDWLMPVVQKIGQLGWQFQLNSYKISNDARFISGENIIQNVAWSTPLLATYNLVVDFLKLYNQNNAVSVGSR